MIKKHFFSRIGFALLIQLITVIFIFNPLFAQNYSPLIRFDVEWIVVEAFEQSVTNKVQFSFDTMSVQINDKNYYKIGNHYLYENIDSQRVYLLDTVDSTDHLYYDFNLAVGDSVKSRVSPSSDWVYIESIDSIFVDSTVRKVLIFNAPDDSPLCVEKWIEGIGSSFGPIGPLNSNYDCWHYRGFLTCYRKQNEQSSLYGECIPSGSERIIEEETLEIFPNPTTNRVSISSTSPIMQIDVFSTSAQVMRQMKVNNNLTDEIQLEELPDGLYFLRIKTEKDTVTKRIIKTAD